MSKQLTLGDGFEKYAKTTKRAQFLRDMDKIVPWADLSKLIAPVYPVAGAGRPRCELEMMLRIDFLQQWFNVSDLAAEDALYDSVSMRSFVGIELGTERAPDETTVCRFRHLLEREKLGTALFEYVLEYLEANGLKVGRGTIVAASIISAPPSTKNKEQKRDPYMNRTKKGNQWFFGMKAHIGVDSRTKVINAAVATAANVRDSHCLPDLLHGDEAKLWGNSVYQGQGDVIAAYAPAAQDMTNRRYRRKGVVDEVERAKNKTKSSAGGGEAEPPFLVIKRIFGFAKTRYKGLATNLHMVRRRLLRLAQGRSVRSAARGTRVAKKALRAPQARLFSRIHRYWPKNSRNVTANSELP